MTADHIHLTPGQTDLLLRESTRQADHYHTRHCAAHAGHRDGSAGCALWSIIEGWCKSGGETLILTKRLSSTEVSQLLSAVDKANNYPTIYTPAT